VTWKFNKDDKYPLPMQSSVRFVFLMKNHF
jgi:hypothetical protein